MKNNVLKIELIITLMIMFGITAFMSCTKENNKVEFEDLSNSELLNTTPVNNFTVTFNHQGAFITNDPKFIKDNHLISKSLSKLNSSITGLKSTKNTSFTINKEGRIISENAYYNNRLFAEVLINDGDLNYFDQDFTVVYDNNGFKSISNEEVFLQNPQLKQNFIDAGAGYKGNVPNNREVSILFSGNKFFVNGKELPLFSNLKAKPSKYEYFKACVGHYWWAIGINIPMCGLAVLIEYW